VQNGWVRLMACGNRSSQRLMSSKLAEFGEKNFLIGHFRMIVFHSSAMEKWRKKVQKNRLLTGRPKEFPDTRGLWGVPGGAPGPGHSRARKHRRALPCRLGRKRAISLNLARKMNPSLVPKYNMKC